jgi:hypothetical protein
VPQKRKPWLVNMVFNGDAFDFDQNGFYATLLDLDRRDIIKVDSSDGTRIAILPSKSEDVDAYERTVLDFLKKNSWKDIFDAQAFEVKVSGWSEANDNDKLARLHKTMDELLHYINESAVRDFVVGRSLRSLGLRIGWDNAGKLIVPLFWAISFFFIFVGGLNILSNPLGGRLDNSIPANLYCGLCPVDPLWKMEAGLLQRKVGMGRFQRFPIRLRHDSEVCPGRSQHLERVVGLWYHLRSGR